MIQARESALQSFELAHQKYREILQNLDEGIQFYTGLLDILTAFGDGCQAFMYARRADVEFVCSSFLLGLAFFLDRP